MIIRSYSIISLLRKVVPQYLGCLPVHHAEVCGWYSLLPPGSLGSFLHTAVRFCNFRFLGSNKIRQKIIFDM